MPCDKTLFGNLDSLIALPNKTVRNLWFWFIAYAPLAFRWLIAAQTKRGVAPSSHEPPLPPYPIQPFSTFEVPKKP